jgi:tetratricopeptide (TPR) repeat protein
MDAHCNLGKAFLSLGDLDSAEACYRKAIEIDPESSVAWQNLSVAGRFGPDDAATIEALQKLLASPTVTDGSRIPLHFALAKIYDDCQRFDEAFEHYQAANRLKHKTLNRLWQCFGDTDLHCWDAALRHHACGTDPGNAPVDLRCRRADLHSEYRDNTPEASRCIPALSAMH